MKIQATHFSGERYVPLLCCWATDTGDSFNRAPCMKPPKKGFFRLGLQLRGGAFDVSRVDMLPTPQHFYY